MFFCNIHFGWNCLFISSPASFFIGFCPGRQVLIELYFVVFLYPILLLFIQYNALCFVLVLFHSLPIFHVDCFRPALFQCRLRSVRLRDYSEVFTGIPVFKLFRRMPVNFN